MSQFVPPLSIRHSYEYLNTHLPHHLRLFLDRSLLSYPYYSQVTRDATKEALRVGLNVLHLTGQNLERYLTLKLEDTAKECARDTVESLRMLRAKLEFSKDFRYLIHTSEFVELENYVNG